MQEKRDSVTRNDMAATASDPLRQVKLELGVVLLLALVVWLLVGRLWPAGWPQLAALGSYGVLAMMWLVARTRRVLARIGVGER